MNLMLNLLNSFFSLYDHMLWKIPSMSRKEWGSGPGFANQNGLSEEFQHSFDKIGGIGISYWAYTLG